MERSNQAAKGHNGDTYNNKEFTGWREVLEV